MSTNQGIRKLYDTIPWDGLGIAASALCTASCVVLPLLPTALSMLGATLSHEALHVTLVYVMLPIATMAFWLGYRRHRSKSVMFLGALGIVAMFVAAQGLHDLFGETSERVMTLGGGLLLFWAHIRNRRLCRCCEAGDENGAAGCKAPGGDRP